MGACARMGYACKNGVRVQEWGTRAKMGMRAIMGYACKKWCTRAEMVYECKNRVRVQKLSVRYALHEGPTCGKVRDRFLSFGGFSKALLPAEQRRYERTSEFKRGGLFGDS